MPTYQQMISQRLLEKGCQEVTCRSKKYRAFMYKQNEQLYFVGKAGALRKGKNISQSHSLGTGAQALKMLSK